MTQPVLKLDHRPTQTLTPRLQYAVRLLQLSALDYEQELHELMGRNPFLELADPVPPPEAPGDGSRAPDTDVDGADIGSAADGAALDPAGAGEADPGAWDEPPPEHDSWLQSPGTIRDGAKDAPTSATELMVAATDLRQHLHGQARLLPLSARDQALIGAVIESLDDDGYLRIDLAELAVGAGLEPAPDACEFNTALHLVQSFEPAGVGARNVGECLRLQLDHVDAALRETARRIATDHLDRLAQRDLAGIAKALGCSTVEADAACAALRRLDPRPGWRFARADARYVAPDVFVRKVRGQWVARLNPSMVPQLRLNRSCAELFQRHRHGGHAELGAHLQEARWTLRNVEQRFSTILAVAQAILRRQALFFEHGPLAMKPLALRDIARDVGVHESTVCRVTNNKYMATPGGLFELKSFFSRAMPMASGGACSATAIRGVVKELIDAEDPTRPLSDVDIAQRLERQGLTVARRTVTKYRQALKIAPAERRRELGGDAAAAGAGTALAAGRAARPARRVAASAAP